MLKQPDTNTTQQVQQATYWRLRNCDRHDTVRFPCKVYSLQIPHPFLANSSPCKFLSLQILFLANSTS